MTIRSTRTAAAWVAGAGAFWSVFIGASVLAAVAIFTVLFVPIYALVAYWLREPLPKREAHR